MFIMWATARGGFCFNNNFIIYLFFVYFRPFYIGKIPNSSLLLVVVENGAEEDHHPKFVTSPQDIIYEGVKNPCHKLILNDLERRTLGGCYNEHPMESTIKECGKCSHHSAKTIFLILNLLILLKL